jgi:hypothetical protein
MAKSVPALAPILALIFLGCAIRKQRSYLNNNQIGANAKGVTSEMVSRSEIES